MKIPPKDNNTKELYRYFEKRFKLGELAIVQAAAICSLDAYKPSAGMPKPLSLMIISPSGTLKSTISDKIAPLFSKTVKVISSRFTPYGLAKRNSKESLDRKTWIINDMVRTFSGLSNTKLAETVGWLTELLSEGSAGSDTAMEAKLDAKINIIGNIALASYRDLSDKFIASTFAERLLQFSYVIDKEYIRKRIQAPEPRIRLTNIKENKSWEITMTKAQQKEIYKLGDELTVFGQYEKQSLRPDEMVKAFIAGYARLNDRHAIKRSDIDIFRQLMPKFKRVV